MSVLASSHGRYIRRYEREIISRVKCLEKIEWTSKGGAWTKFFLEKPYLYKKDIVIIICGGNELTKLSPKIVKANLVKLAQGAKCHSDLVLIFSLWPRDGENSAYQQKVEQLNSMMFEVYPRENAQVNGIVFYRWDKRVYTTTVDGTHLTEGGYRRAALCIASALLWSANNVFCC